MSNKTEQETDGNVPENKASNILNPESTFCLTIQENCQRIRKYASGKTYIQYTRIHCTACNRHLGSAMANFRNVFVHPMLKVLICKICLDFYHSGDFVKDDDGKECCCRWCGQGETLVCCTRCPMVFCKVCIGNNFNKAKYLEILCNDEWKCFSCDAGQLSSLRMQCYAFREYCISQMSDPLVETTNSVTKLIDYSKCCTPNDRPFKRIRSKHAGDVETHSLVKLVKLSPNIWPSNSQSSDSDTKRLKTPEGYENGDKDAFMFPKPFTFVNVSPAPGTNVSHSVPQATSIITKDSPSLALAPAQDIHHGSVPRQYFLHRSEPQKACTLRTFNSNEIPEYKTRQNDKTICETALVNSTFASAILQLSQLIHDKENLHDHIEIYNALQECLSTCVTSLERLKGYLTSYN